MRIVDTLITRERGNSVWANIVFVGDRGETVSVRLACPVPYGGAVGRDRTVARAVELLREVIAAREEAVSRELTPPARFGATPGAARAQNGSWGTPSSGEE